MRTRFPSLRSNTDSRAGAVATLAIVCFAQALLADRAAAQDLLVRCADDRRWRRTPCSPTASCSCAKARSPTSAARSPPKRARRPPSSTTAPRPSCRASCSRRARWTRNATSPKARCRSRRTCAPSEAFDPWQEELLRLPQHGVTSLLLAPSPRNLAGGLGALVKPGSEAAGGRVVTAELHLALSLAQVARNPEREPTSLMGAIDALRTALQKAKSGLATGPDALILRGVLDGNRKVTIAADTYPELLGALDLAREFGFQPVLLGATEAHKLMPRLLEQKATMVLNPLRFDQPERQLQLPRLLAEAGVPFCFGGSAESLRLSAVLAVKHGLDRKTALTALTRTPAQTFDQTTQVGALRQGCGADFAVFGGDPLDLGSPHLATWIDGVCVHGTMPAVGERPSSATKSPKAAPAAGVR
jgi:hypothetical protein